MPSYERGLAYLEAGRVGPLRASAGRVGATVQGSEDYLVELRLKGGKLRFSCSCPIGRDGAFCKHCVAVALAWQREHDDPPPTLEDARAHLETLPQGEPVDVLWLKLANLKRAEHPEDALGVYRRHVEDVIAGKNKRAYAEAVRLIDETMRELYAESGRPEDFDSYVDEVRAAHKPKRNLMKPMAALEPAR